MNRFVCVAALVQLATLLKSSICSGADHLVAETPATAAKDEETKVYAVLFPQFHKDPVNDWLWGDGFTDWTSVIQAPNRNIAGKEIARPNARIGYYDQALYETRRRQALMAKKFGVDGFLIHHYWFNQPGMNATLARPLENMLLDGEPDHKFAINWARDSWTATWQGRGRVAEEQLIMQKCLLKTDPMLRDHYNFLRRFFFHKNYIKINGVPLFSLYGWQYTGNCNDHITFLREAAQADGFPEPGLHLMTNLGEMRKHVLYQPAETTGGTINTYPYHPKLRIDAELYYPFANLPRQHAQIPEYCFQGKKGPERSPLYIGTITEFDNTPRRNLTSATLWARDFLHGDSSSSNSGRSGSTAGSAAQSFEYDLVQVMMYERCCQNAKARSRGGKFVLINAWNEWGEGMQLEPSTTRGSGFLAAVREAKRVVRRISCDWSELKIFNEQILK